MKFPRNERLRVILGVVAVALGCLAIGIWMHHRLVVAEIWKTAEEEAMARLATDTAELRHAVAAEGDAATLGGCGGWDGIRRLLAARGRPADAGWLAIDSQGRILAELHSACGAPPTIDDETLAWRRGPTPAADDAHALTGVLRIGGERHAAVLTPLAGGVTYLMAHRPLDDPCVSYGAVSGSLLADGFVAWFWGGTLLATVVYLIVARFYDRLQRQRMQMETEALRRIQSLVRTRDAILYSLAGLAESRDEITGRHLDRVAFYACRLALAVRDHPRFHAQITQEFLELLETASTLHDIGKVCIEDSILCKPGPLTQTELARMRQHTVLGAKYLGQIEQRLGRSPVIRMARDIALRHHERWDGTGYPDGLAGEEAPLAARIVALADVYEALSSRRDYKPPYPHEKCVQIIRAEAGRQFDPDLVEGFLRVEETFRQFALTYGDESTGARPSPRPETADRAHCSELAATMQVLDPGRTVPLPPVVPR